MAETPVELKDLESDEVRPLVDAFRTAMGRIRDEVGKVIVGQDDVVEHLLITLLVGGHCLITGMPGTAKTLLVRTLVIRQCPPRTGSPATNPPAFVGGTGDCTALS